MYYHPLTKFSNSFINVSIFHFNLYRLRNYSLYEENNYRIVHKLLKTLQKFTRIQGERCLKCVAALTSTDLASWLGLAT